MVTVTSNGPRLNVGSMPIMLNPSTGVQNLTISSSVQSNARSIIGSGAPVTILTNALDDFPPSPSLHISIRENIGSYVAFSDPLRMSLTCWRPLGSAAADDALVIPPLSLDTNVNARLAVLLSSAYPSH